VTRNLKPKRRGRLKTLRPKVHSRNWRRTTSLLAKRVRGTSQTRERAKPSHRRYEHDEGGTEANVKPCKCEKCGLNGVEGTLTTSAEESKWAVFRKQRLEKKHKTFTPEIPEVKNSTLKKGMRRHAGKIIREEGPHWGQVTVLGELVVGSQNPKPSLTKTSPTKKWIRDLRHRRKKHKTTKMVVKGKISDQQSSVLQTW